MKILHTGDWHIGNFGGPEIGGQNARYLDICTCLDALTASALAERPDLIVVAGDVFHQAKVWSDRGLKESRTAIRYIRLLEKVAPVVVVRGTPNHDSEQQFAMLKTAFEGDDSVHIYTEPGVHRVYSHAGEEALIAALPGFDRGYYRAQNPGLDREEENERFTAILDDIIIGMRATCNELGNEPAILVSHFTIPGCCMESGQTQFFAQFEPVVYPATLNAAGFDLVCFGHIHRPQKIEDVENTFYSGAISALNFNDEGQRRGFWYHFTDGQPSHFVPLPTREFLTIRLDGADIEMLNEGFIGILAAARWKNAVAGKITRVIYSCTDAQNKALNKAALENALYVDGAFWVQEIMPESITATVNRDALGDDSSPEDNLRRYLDERDTPPEELGQLVEIARPIIAEATAASATTAQTGTFMPVEIAVRNYRNYRDETFSFDGIRFCTINGANGVGKSSLFMDAILDALYEEPREGDLTGWICNDESARSGAITFTFRLGSRTFRVTRTRQKSGKATLNLSEQVDGEWVDRSCEKIRDTQAEIINTIGMDSLTLKACALIMQDQYGLFLTADKEQRMTILGNILGLGIYEVMEDITGTQLTNANRAIRTLHDRYEEIVRAMPNLDELAATEAATAEKLARCEQEGREQANVVAAKRAALNTMLDAAQRAMRIQASIATLTSRRATTSSSKISQLAIITNSDAILAESLRIAAGVKLHSELLEEEKSLISSLALYDSMTARRWQLAQEIDEGQAALNQIAARRAAAEIALATARKYLENEPELTAKHAECEAVRRAVEDMEAHIESYNALEGAVDAAELAAAKAKYEDKQGQQQRQAYLQTLRQKSALLDDSGCPTIATASCRFLADAVAARDNLPQAEAELDEYKQTSANAILAAQQDLDLARDALKSCVYDPAKISELRVRLRTFSGSETQYQALAMARNDALHAEETIDDLERQAAEVMDKKSLNQAEHLKLSDELENLQSAASRSRELKAQISDAAIWIERERQLPVAEEQKRVAQERVNELTATMAEIDAEIADKTAELEQEKATAAGAGALRAEVDAIDAEIKAGTETIRELTMTLGVVRERQERAAAAREQAASILAEKSALSRTAARLETLKKAFSQDGIPHNVIRSIIPIFEANATNILGAMSGGKMAVEFVTEKVLKSNAKKEVTTLDIIINDADTGRLAYMSRSGGERVKAALAVILALAEIKSTKAGVQLGFLFIDEPPFLDAQGIQAYCDALEAIQGRYSDLKVMAITHDPTMKARFPQSIDVVKTTDGSKVLYE